MSKTSLQVLAEIMSDYSTRHMLRAGGRFFNHVNHGAIALYKLGANPEEIQNFANDYLKLYPQYTTLNNGEKSITNKDEIISLRGKFQQLYSLRTFFRSELKDKYHGNGILLLNEYFPELITGISSELVHPLIHLSWAMLIIKDIPSGGSEMIADGLAYLIYAYHSIEPKKKETGLSQSLSSSRVSLLQIIDSVNKSSIFDIDEINKLCIQFLTTDTKEDCKENKLVEQFQDEITSVMWLLYFASNRNFFVLHFVTCWYGLRHLLPILNNPKQFQLMKSFLLSIFEVYCAQQKPGKSSDFLKIAIEKNSINSASLLIQREYATKLKGSEDMNFWEKLRQQGIKPDEPHQIKIFHILFHDGVEVKPKVEGLDILLRSLAIDLGVKVGSKL